MLTKENLINMVLFQAVWFACVLGGGSYGLLWPGAVALAALILSLSNAACMRQDVLLAVLAMPLGFALDTLWIELHILDYPGHSVAPYWIVFMWIGVALTVNHSLRPLRDRPVLGALVCGVFAPVSYLAGERLGAINIVAPQQLWMVCIAWALVFFFGFGLARRGLQAWQVEDAA